MNTEYARLPQDDPNSGWMPDWGRPATGQGVPGVMELFWLLGKYAAHVESVEGTSFTGASHVGGLGFGALLSDREAAWVRRALREYREFPNTYTGERAL